MNPKSPPAFGRNSHPATIRERHDDSVADRFSDRSTLFGATVPSGLTLNATRIFLTSDRMMSSAPFLLYPWDYICLKAIKR